MISRFKPILQALNQAQVEYVVVGGMAVNLHGYLRFTKDLDLALNLSAENTLRAMRVFGDFGFKPRVPVRLEDFANLDLREEWFAHRNMVVFQIYHPDDPFLTIDLFVQNPIQFDDLHERSALNSVLGIETRVASLRDLIQMKRQVARPQDLHDVAELEKILTLRTNHD